VSRRDQIRMTDDEVASFLDEQRVVTCASIGPDGRPHLMPPWFVPDDGTLLAWTYAASQKAVNLRRDPRPTLQCTVTPSGKGFLLGPKQLRAVGGAAVKRT
jgi:nitroimidazol reductase NimA-like FMN-containing flavoprotein (pyridoxamine 5'-phosphate oxidase superfamily)